MPAQQGAFLRVKVFLYSAPDREVGSYKTAVAESARIRYRDGAEIE